MAIASKVYRKDPRESRLYNLDFSGFPELQAGSAITKSLRHGAAVEDGQERDDGELVVSNPRVSQDGTIVQFRIDGGTDECLYQVWTLVRTDRGDELLGAARLLVLDPLVDSVE